MKKIIEIYTDGACVPNPGQGGIGAVFRYGDKTKVMAKSIGDSTNNIAELRAIKDSLLTLKKRNIPIKIYTDSQYSANMFTKNWKPKKNVELINEMKELIKEFKDIEFIWIKGHNGHQWNELSDFLANAGIALKKTHEQIFNGSFNKNEINL